MDIWFERLDINKDGKLAFEEIKPFLVKYLQDEHDIDPGKSLIEETFLEIGSHHSAKTKQELFDFVKEVIEMRD